MLPDVFVVGEAGGFGGAHIAMAQGKLSGIEAVRRLGYHATANADAGAALVRHGRFQRKLWSLFAAPAEQLDTLPDETIICRCEAIKLGDLRGADGRLAARSPQGLKHLSRAGMGRCQGRYCGHVLQAVLKGERPIVERDILLPQVPIRPVVAEALARPKPEWLGHKREPLPDFPPAGDGVLPTKKVDVAIVGAGIAGISTALFLARSGASVALLDSGRPNGVASGGNAGSLHGQLLSFDFARPVSGITPQIATLNLQRHAIALWKQLQTQSPADFELKITGGLMVAETAAELDRLAIKAEVEREQGIDSRLIDPAELYALEPCLGEGFIGAVYCSTEGKINPLLASHALLDLAREAGATVHAGCAVTGISGSAGGFQIETSRGTLQADRIVNAAGAFAGKVSALLDLEIPVHGAPLQMIVTEAAEPVVSNLLAHASRHLTLKQAANGNLLIGGGWSAGLDQVTRKPRTLRDSIEGNLEVARSVLPAAGRLKILRSWAAMNIDIDGAPILGEDPRHPGFFTAVGANGYTMGPLFGRLTADLILGRDPHIDIGAFSIARFHNS